MIDASMPIPTGYVLIGTVSVDVKLAGAVGGVSVKNGSVNDNGTKHVTMNLLRKQ